MEIMYQNMWQFINPDMISYILRINVSFQKDIDNDVFKTRHKNTICFKGDEDEGHYVFVDDNLNAYGTYEKNLLYRVEDDGVCHGAAISYALYFLKNRLEFRLLNDPSPKDMDAYRYNYKTILNVYIYLIESGEWDKALENYFYKDVHWIEPDRKTTVETQKALETLKEYIKRF
jgi:hypothetical protein